MDNHGLTPETLGGLKVTQPQIDQAVQTVRKLCGWHIWPVREEEVALTARDPVILLPTGNLLDLRRLRIDGEEVPLDTVRWDHSGVVYVPGFRRRENGGPRMVLADIRHGYDHPADIIGVIAAMATRSATPQTSYTVGRIAVGAAAAATPQSTEWRVIDGYKLGPVP